MKVTIIGGGPVGTLTGIRLLEDCGNNINVELYEKRSEYNRDHILLLNKNSLALMPSEVLRALEQLGCYVDNPHIDRSGRCYTSNTEDGFFAAKTAFIEEIQMNYFEALGGTAKRNVGIQELPTDTDIIVVAPGRRESEKFLREVGIPVPQKKEAGKAVVLVWQPAKHQTAIAPRPQRKEKNNKMQERYIFYRAQQDNYYAAIQLTEDEYAELAALARSKHTRSLREPSLFLSDVPVDSGLLETFENVFDFYNIQQRERAPPSKIRLDLLDLKLWKAPQTAVMWNDKLVLFAGDAVFGVHMFSGATLNTGYQMAAAAAHVVCEVARGKLSLEDAMELFNTKVDELLEMSQTASRHSVLKYGEASIICSANTDTVVRSCGEDLLRDTRGLTKREVCMLIANAIVENPAVCPTIQL